MPLDYNINNLDDVDDAVRSLYKEVEGSDGFELDVDLGPLKRAKQHEKDQRKMAEGRVRDLEQEMQTMTSTVEDLRTKASTAEGAISTYLVQQEAERIATTISDSPHLLMPWVKDRLKGELVDGKMKLTVLSKDGLATDASTEDLMRELRADESFAAIIISSRASGGGATGSRGRFSPSISAKDMSSEQRLKLKRENPAKFRELFINN